MKVAIQGEAGSFSHEAAKRMLPGCAIVCCARSVAEHFDLLLTRNVFIQQEYRLRIVHNLIAAPGVKMGDIRRVYSHPVALDQCRDFFQKHPRIEATPFYDTAGSVKH